MIRDFAAGLRRLANKPIFASIVISLLGVGIGASILIFGFADALLLKPLPVRNLENLWIVQTPRKYPLQPGLMFSYGQFEELRKRTDLFSAVTAEQDAAADSAYPTDDATLGSRLVMTQMLAPNYFREPGVNAISRPGAE